MYVNVPTIRYYQRPDFGASSISAVGGARSDAPEKYFKFHVRFLSNIYIYIILYNGRYFVDTCTHKDISVDEIYFNCSIISLCLYTIISVHFFFPVYGWSTSFLRYVCSIFMKIDNRFYSSLFLIFKYCF